MDLSLPELASIVAIVSGSLGFVLAIRRRELSRPKLELYPFILHSSIIESKSIIERILKWRNLSQMKNSGTFVAVYCDPAPANGKLVTQLPLIIANRGDVPLENVSLYIKYHADWAMTNEEMKSHVKFERQVVQSDDPSLLSIVTPSTEHNQESMAEFRSATRAGGIAQVRYDIPVLRPRELVTIGEPIIFQGKSKRSMRSAIESIPGFHQIAKRLLAVKGVDELLTAYIEVYANNSEPKTLVTTLLRIKAGEDSYRNEQKLIESMREIGRQFWLGSFPKPGVYFENPYEVFFKRLFKKTGRVGRGFGRYIWSYVYFVPSVKVKLIDGKKIAIENDQRSEFSATSFYVPNCDYYELPPSISESSDLMEWLNVPGYTLKRKS